MIIRFLKILKKLNLDIILSLMKEAYEKMGLTALANDTQKIIDANKDKTFAPIEKPDEPELKVPTAK